MQHILPVLRAVPDDVARRDDVDGDLRRLGLSGNFRFPGIRLALGLRRPDHHRHDHGQPSRRHVGLGHPAQRRVLGQPGHGKVNLNTIQTFDFRRNTNI